MKKITIAIDGYSSCGKSTMAKDLARRIGYVYVDTGAMYRAVTLYALRNGLFAEDGSVLKIVEHKDEYLSHIPAIAPVKNPKIYSGFGVRVHPIYKIARRHTGIDFIGKRGEPIYATADGVVSQDGAGSGYGISVVINHGNGYRTVYAHLSKKAVRGGQKVKRGEVIGYMGSSGLSSGIHLHYEVEKNGQKINPIHFFFADLSPEEYEQMLKEADMEN